MAVTRNSSNSPLPYFGPLSGISAYANRGGEIFHYVSTQTNPYDVLNATYRVHVFDTPGEQSIYFDRAGSVDVLAIGGGGSGGTAYEAYQCGGGGGAGGLLESYNVAVDSGETRIKVGLGGLGKVNQSGEPTRIYFGEDSTFGALIAFGGAVGGSRGNNSYPTYSGGSGGGATDTVATGGDGVPGQGNPGGSTTYSWDQAAGGGGAGEPGASITGQNQLGHGGNGRSIAFYSNTAYYYAGGGAGSTSRTGIGDPQGGLGGGASQVAGYAKTGIDATFYGGGGSGGNATTSNGWYTGGAGYQGLVMVRYRIG